jgi:hypothetical protein
MWRLISIWSVTTCPGSGFKGLLVPVKRDRNEGQNMVPLTNAGPLLGIHDFIASTMRCASFQPRRKFTKVGARGAPLRFMAWMILVKHLQWIHVGDTHSLGL